MNKVKMGKINKKNNRMTFGFDTEVSEVLENESLDRRADRPTRPSSEDFTPIPTQEPTDVVDLDLTGYYESLWEGMPDYSLPLDVGNNDEVFTSEDALGDDADVFTNDDPTIVVGSADTWDESTSWSDNLTEMIEDESIEDFFEDNLGVDVVEVSLDSVNNDPNQDKEPTTKPTTTTTQEEEDEEPTLDLGGDSKYLYLIGLGILVLALALRKK